MIEFKRNFQKILPYDRKGYLRYQSGGRSSVKWYGVSFQVAEIADQIDASFQQYLEMYEPLFVNLISEFDNDSSWIVNHDLKNSPPYVATGKKGVLYRDLDISQSELPAIMRISGHLNIDFICTEQQIFRKIINANYASGFVVKEYRGN